MKTLLRKLEVKIRYAIWAYQRLSYPTTYDKINYQGELGYCQNGVNAPYWKISLKDERVHERHLLVIRDFKRDFRVFKQHYNFQMSYWYSIDYRNPLFSRISYLNSSNIKFKN